MDYLVTGSGGWGQLPVGVWLTVRIVVQYDLQRATNLSEVLLCYIYKKKKNFSKLFLIFLEEPKKQWGV